MFAWWTFRCQCEFVAKQCLQRAHNYRSAAVIVFLFLLYFRCQNTICGALQGNSIAVCGSRFAYVEYLVLELRQMFWYTRFGYTGFGYTWIEWHVPTVFGKLLDIMCSALFFTESLRFVMPDWSTYAVGPYILSGRSSNKLPLAP